jgi:hypothetical protein
MRRTTRYVVPAAALVLALAGCADTERRPASGTPTPSPSSTPSPTVTESAPDGASAEPSPTATGSTAAGGTAGGTADRPAVLQPQTAPLDWRPVAGSVEQTVTRGGGWTLSVDQAGSRATLVGPSGRSSWSSGSHERVSETLLDADHAVVVFQDEFEEDPSRAIVTDLASGKKFKVDDSSDIPTTSGGTWALGNGHLLHATIRKRAYCIASVDLATRASTLGWCAPARQGFNQARISPAGDTITTFDDSQPSCRTVSRLEGRTTEPFPGVADCHGWEGVLIEDGAVWSVVPNERRIENGHLYARVGDGYFDLGPGSTGTLTWCGDAAYFARDPQRRRDDASLMRWSPEDGLSTVYESPGGQAFLEAPRCGGDTITITALAQAGDEQVSAAVR